MTNNDLAEAISELKDGQRALQEQIRDLKTMLDELTGARKVLLWITATAIAMAGIVTAWFDLNRHR